MRDPWMNDPDRAVRKDSPSIPPPGARITKWSFTHNTLTAWFNRNESPLRLKEEK
jgi:hypothetical protein